VDLLDVAFHRDTAPVVIHHKTTSGLVMVGLRLCRADNTSLTEFEKIARQIPQKRYLLNFNSAPSPLRC
jgi:hypothetical protein